MIIHFLVKHQQPTIAKLFSFQLIPKFNLINIQKSVGFWVRQVSLHNVGGSFLVQGPRENTVRSIKKEFCLWMQLFPGSPAYPTCQTPHSLYTDPICYISLENSNTWIKLLTTKANLYNLVEKNSYLSDYKDFLNKTKNTNHKNVTIIKKCLSKVMINKLHENID